MRIHESWTNGVLTMSGHWGLFDQGELTVGTVRAFGGVDFRVVSVGVEEHGPTVKVGVAASDPKWHAKRQVVITAHEVMDPQSAYLAKPYAAGTSVVDILADLCAACGLTVDRDQLLASLMDALEPRGIAVDSLELTTGYNASGRAWDQIQLVMDSLGLHWAAQDGRFTLL